MKILRIRFENLNSLRKGDIDLENEPLASAGIFAITGPTGTGKSTILDAITLALYGRAARYDAVSNPADMMSRHTGSCSAEVVFEVPKGRFVASWSLRRARGKVDGALQAAERRVVDAAGTVLTAKIREADEEIERLTGLDYERFLRSVMLAQGQFSRFLQSNTKDRSGLLAELTGTSIYSSISQMAYAEATRKSAELAVRTRELEQVVLLTREEASALAGELTALETRETAAQGELDQLSQQVERGLQLGKLVVQSVNLTHKQAQGDAASASFLPSRQNLEKHDRAEKFAAALRTFEELEAATQRSAVSLEEARVSLRQSRVELVSGLGVAKALGDAALAAQQKGVLAAEAVLVACQKKASEVDAWLLQHRADEGLDAALVGLVASLAELREARRGLQKARGEIEDLQKAAVGEQEAAERVKDALAVADKSEKKARLDAEKAEADLRNALQGRTVEGIDSEIESLHKKGSALKELRAALETNERVVELQNEVANEETALAAQVEQALEQKIAAEREAQAQADVLASAQERLSRIESLDDKRAELKGGESCPLCGSTEHPYVTHGTEQRATPSREIQEMRRNHEMARMANETAQREAKLAADFVTTKQAEMRARQGRRAELRNEGMAAYEAFTKLARGLRLYTAEAIEAAEGDTAKALGDFQEKRVQVRGLEQARVASRAEHLELQGEVKRLTEALEAKLLAAKKTQERILALQGEEAVLAKSVASVSETLAATLAAFGASVPAEGEEERLSKALEKRRLEFQNQQRAKAECLEEKAKAGREKERLSERHSALCVEIESALGRKAGDFFEDVAVASDVVSRLKRQWKDWENAKGALEALRAGILEWEAKSKDRAAQTEELTKRSRQQSAELAKLLRGSEFADIDALRAALLSPEAVTALRKQKAALDQEAAELAGQVKEIARQIVEMRDAGVPEGDELVHLTARKERVSEELRALVASVTAAKNRLEEDARKRVDRERRELEFQGEKREVEVWDRLNSMIGSANGDKFSRFAQGISLDLLIRYANRHLGSFNDRYQLKRVPGEALELEIVDGYQAQVCRPVRSLSGGETFLVSLALALGLSDMAGRKVRIDSLFIDEGFGSLDAESLDVAIAALDALRRRNKTVGVISHVELLKERIPVQIRVERGASGVSTLRLETSGFAEAER